MDGCGEENFVSTEEAVWLEQARQGDDLAFAQIVEAYQRPVYNLCYRMLGDGYEAEDAAQETFLRAYKYLKRYDPSRSFATWLLSIASHHCIDIIRKRRMRLVPIEALPGETLPDPGLTPEMEVRLGEDQQAMQDLLQELSPTDRSAVILYYWYEYSYEEIAQTLSLTVSAVKSRLHRARKALGAAWQNRKAESESALTRKRHESPAF
jgi:RNA polymerase sigma-70 factor (ECF subfamily)